MGTTKEIQKHGHDWKIIEESQDTINKRLAERLEKEADYIKRGLDKQNFYKL